MTVGVAAITEQDSEDSRVVIAADRLITTHQQSAIEHESPSTKIKETGGTLPNIQAAVVYSGNTSWAEEIHEQVQQKCFEQSQTDGKVDAHLFMQICRVVYREFSDQKINNQILNTYGISLEDLKAQHRFKDSFITSVRTEIENAEQEINNQLRMLVGGIERNSGEPFVFDVVNSDYNRRSDQGYGVIGSGEQPAFSEFLESEYGPTESFKTGLATVTAATLRAQSASGVGGDIDIWTVGETFIEEVPEPVVTSLSNRYDEISNVQDRVKENLREHKTVDWKPNQ